MPRGELHVHVHAMAGDPHARLPRHGAAAHRSAQDRVRQSLPLRVSSRAPAAPFLEAEAPRPPPTLHAVMPRPSSLAIELYLGHL